MYKYIYVYYIFTLIYLLLSVLIHQKILRKTYYTSYVQINLNNHQLFNQVFIDII